MSFENKYEMIEEKDNSEKMAINSYNGTDIALYEKDKHKIIKIINKENNDIIYQYRQFNSSPPLNKFIKINDNIWWFGGTDCETKLFLNCDTKEIFKDQTNPFIWTGPYILSPDNKYMLMDGCFWAFPYQTKLYDISDLKNGYKEIDMYDNLVLPLDRFNDNDNNNDFIDIDDSGTCSYEFISNNEINIYKYEKNNKIYYNTIKIPK